MFGGKRQKDSDHFDFYAREKNVEEAPTKAVSSEDPLYKFKKNVNLSTQYEVYLQTERRLKLEEKKAKEFSPMEILARKIKRDEHLTLTDLQNWVQYNFLVFKDEDQQRIKSLAEHQQWFWKWMSVLLLPLSFSSYAVLHFHYRKPPVKAMVFTGLGLYSMTWMGTLSSKAQMDKYYRELYDKYRDEVLLPQYRGLKLVNGKVPSQIDNKEATTSHFDDLKALINKNRK